MSTTGNESNPAPSERKVYFKLRCGGNTTDATSLSIGSTCTVDDFKEKVKNAVKNDAAYQFLSNTSNLRIFVYRNEGTSGGNEQSLLVDQTLEGFGTSAKESLVVVVPQSPQSSYGDLSVSQTGEDSVSEISSRETTSHNIQDEYVPRKRQRTGISDLTMQFKSFVNAKLVNGCIQSEDQALLPYSQDEIKNLYVRKCYKDVFTLLLQRVACGIVKSFAISGTPGIGKSLFFLYMLYRLVKDFHAKTLSLKPNLILYQVGSTYQCFDLQRQIVTELSKLDAGQVVREQDTFYVIDGRNSQPLLSSCIVLFISSPRTDYYKEFVKQKMAKQWYFPVWTLDELLNCHRLCYSALPIETLRERYRVFGGVARFVFHKDDPAAVLRIMEETLADVDAVKGVRNIGSPTKIFSTSHTLLHVVVSNDTQYQFCYVDIASKYVGEELWILHSAQMITNLQEMFGGSPNEISRHLFEIYGHLVFSTGRRTLKCKCLETGILSEFTLDDLGGRRITFGKDTLPSTAQLSGNYYEPTCEDNFPAIDSLSDQGMFQFSVAPEHPIRGVKILRKLCALFEEPKLYFVVPPHRFAAFKKQSFKAMTGSNDVADIPQLKQYVLELPVIQY